MIIGTLEGTVRAWAAKRKPLGEQRAKDMLKGIKGNPRQPGPNKLGSGIPIHVNFEEVEEIEAEETAPLRREGARGMKLTDSVFAQYGYTEGCEGCNRKKAGMQQRPHTETCRKRLA